jgi:hypothetical protein
MARLRAHGLTVTEDWTAAPPAGVTSDAELAREQRAAFALADAGGVERAELLWLLAPNEKGSCGAWWEFGYARGLGIPVVVSGARWDRSIFTELAQHRFDRDVDALVWIVDLARRREAPERLSG